METSSFFFFTRSRTPNAVFFYFSSKVKKERAHTEAYGRGERDSYTDWSPTLEITEHTQAELNCQALGIIWH